MRDAEARLSRLLTNEGKLRLREYITTPSNGPEPVLENGFSGSGPDRDGGAGSGEPGAARDGRAGLSGGRIDRDRGQRSDAAEWADRDGHPNPKKWVNLFVGDSPFKRGWAVHEPQLCFP
ncbi:hypothetical protein GCM10022198_20270 [Klugiella xanthotipulae]